MKTEFIAFSKLISTKDGDKYVVTTVTGAVIWVEKSKFNESAEKITYMAHKAGDEFVANRDSKRLKADNATPLYLKGDKVKRETDSNEFKSHSKFNTLDIMDHLISKGVTPSFTLTSVAA